MAHKELPRIRIVSLGMKPPNAKAESVKQECSCACQCQSDICACQCEAHSDCSCEFDPPHCSGETRTPECSPPPQETLGRRGPKTFFKVAGGVPMTELGKMSGGMQSTSES